MMTMSMPWRSRRSRKPAVWRQWRCTDGPEPSTTADRQTGISSYYSGQADWDIIAQVKDAVKIPVIGNGDVDSPEKAKAILEQTGCDGVMIGRAAEGNPWIFREVVSYLENGTIPARPTNREKREMILRHAALQLEYKGEYTGVREMRKHLSWYTVGMPHSAHFRQTINTMEKMDELIRGVQEIFPDEV